MTQYEQLVECAKAVTDHENCVEWWGSFKPNGYGQLTRKGKTLWAHRVSLAAYLGRDLKDSELACHRCDNPRCVNPLHLFVGDHSLNALDMCSKNRGSTQYVKGHQPYATKLTLEQVREIRDRAEPYHHGLYTKLAKEYGISRVHISNIVKGKYWGQLS